MAFKKKKTPFMVSKERELMKLFFNQIKRWKGLTSIIATSGGINGKWFDPNNPYEITSTKGMRMVSIKAAFQEEDEFIKDAMEFRQFSIEFCKTTMGSRPTVNPNQEERNERRSFRPCKRQSGATETERHDCHVGRTHPTGD